MDRLKDKVAVITQAGSYFGRAVAEAYAEEGADALFIEAPTDDEEIARVGTELASTGLPLVANMVEGGKTPLHSAAELAELGFRLVIFPGLLSRITVRAVTEALAVLAEGGDSRPLLDRVTQFSDMQRMLELDELNARVAAYELEDTDVAPS